MKNTRYCSSGKFCANLVGCLYQGSCLYNAGACIALHPLTPGSGTLLCFPSLLVDWIPTLPLSVTLSYTTSSFQPIGQLDEGKLVLKNMNNSRSLNFPFRKHNYSNCLELRMYTNNSIVRVVAFSQKLLPSSPRLASLA